MFTQFTFTLLTLSHLALSAPTPTTPSPESTTLLPLYINGQNINTTTYNTHVPAALPTQPTTITPPTPFTHIDNTTHTNVTIVSQNVAGQGFALPPKDTQLFATFALEAYHNATGTHPVTDSIPNGKLDIGAKLVNEAEAVHPSNTVHIMVLRDPMTAKGVFSWDEGRVVVEALREWSYGFAEGSFAPCAGVSVISGSGDMVAQGNFCGAPA